MSEVRIIGFHWDANSGVTAHLGDGSRKKYLVADVSMTIANQCSRLTGEVFNGPQLAELFGCESIE